MKKISHLLFLVLITSSHLFAQKGEWYLEKTTGGVCNQSIILFPDGTYNLESGCEAASHFSFGKWTQKKDTVFFSVINNKNFKVIQSYSSRKVDNKNLTVKIVDNKGQNITSRISVGQYVKNKGTYMLNPDSTKTIKVDYKREGGVIVLRSLQKLFDQKIEMETDSSNYYEITLNISNEWIFHSSADWGGHGDFKLLKTKQGLTSVAPDITDSHGSPVKIVFIRQEE